jgi:serine/threonine protein kinase
VYGDGYHYALVFETLGTSLYEFIKANGYKGFQMSIVQKFAKQILEGVEFLHSMELTHTDLKPENILLKKNGTINLKDPKDWPKNV